MAIDIRSSYAPGFSMTSVPGGGGYDPMAALHALMGAERGAMAAPQMPNKLGSKAQSRGGRVRVSGGGESNRAPDPSGGKTPVFMKMTGQGPNQIPGYMAVPGGTPGAAFAGYSSAASPAGSMPRSSQFVPDSGGPSRASLPSSTQPRNPLPDFGDDERPDWYGSGTTSRAGQLEALLSARKR